MNKFACLVLAAMMLAGCGQAPSAPRMASVKQGAQAAKGHVYTLDEMGVAKKQLRALEDAGITNSADLLVAARTDYGRGKLVTTTRMDEICVLWPRDAGDARLNEITTDAFADPKHSEDPKWLHTAIGISMMGLFCVAALYLLITIALSILRPATGAV